MNNKFYYAFVVVFTFSMSLFLYSCVEDKCGAVKCENEGVCVQGECACKYGYEGEFCHLLWYEKFSGGWKADETDRQGNILRSYDVNALYYRATDSFIVIGMPNEGDTVFCRRKAYNVFTIDSKKLPGKDSLIGGEATLNNDATVTGLYSLMADTVEKRTIFKWSR